MFGDPVLNSRQHAVRKLADLGELNRGVSKARPRNMPDLLGGPYPLIQTGEVAAAQLYIDSYENTYSEKGLAQSRMWPKGTLCITIAANIAQTAILAIDACFPDSVVGFIPGDEITQIYMHYWFSFFQKILDEQAPQVAQKNINLKILSNLDVMVPPIELQKQFEDFVKQSDKSKFAWLKSQFIEMFGLPENNTHGFDTGVIGEVVKDVHYGTAKKSSDDGKYVYLRMNNITYDGELDLTDIKRIDVSDKDLPGCIVKTGDVLFNRTNSKDLVGKTCYFSGDEPMIIAGYIIRLRMNGKVLPEYLSVFMNLERSKKMLYSMAKGAVGQANINAKEVQSIEIVIPPMDIQKGFLTLFHQSDKSK